MNYYSRALSAIITNVEKTCVLCTFEEKECEKCQYKFDDGCFQTARIEHIIRGLGSCGKDIYDPNKSQYEAKSLFDIAIEEL